MAVHACLFVAMLLAGRQDVSVFKRELPLMILTVFLIGYLSYIQEVAASRYAAYDTNVGTNPFEWGFTMWLLVEMSVPMGMVLSSAVFMIGRFLFNESFI